MGLAKSYICDGCEEKIDQDSEAFITFTPEVDPEDVTLTDLKWQQDETKVLHTKCFEDPEVMSAVGILELLNVEENTYTVDRYVSSS